jgi:prepilin-type N-terminal cleavage/methylation domain-containing protein
MLKMKLRNQKGFTLIEIIAVLVILGILAAIAIPKYLDMADDARHKALSGAVASLISAASMDYSQKLLNGQASATSFSPVGSHTVGDFSGTILPATGSTGTFNAAVTGYAPSAEYATALGTSFAYKTFRLF